MRKLVETLYAIIGGFFFIGMFAGYVLFGAKASLVMGIGLVLVAVPFTIYQGVRDGR